MSHKLSDNVIYFEYIVNYYIIPIIEKAHSPPLISVNRFPNHV